MCGIAGFAGKGDERIVRDMVQAIHYRGPDTEGVFVGKDFGLGHARLSIIDLTPGGHQPMWNSAHNAIIVFNGEIYNFQELRTDAQRDGYHFTGTSDTEVILALYSRYGKDGFKKLNGMFAIALYDLEKKTLFLVRDRMGKKPLYYGVFNDTLLFASEPKALFLHPHAQRKINIEALNAYLALDYVPTPLSIYENVSKLEPATILTFANGEIQKEVFWSPPQDALKLNVSTAATQLDELLSASVASRLVSDVPLGVFLSGGLDSSTVAYYASRATREPIHTFSIGFNEMSFDESAYAEKVAGHLGTDHHHKILSGEDSLRVMPKVFEHLDEPMADASIIPTYLLAEFTREHVTVALGGDGGDELFAGYQTFQAEKAYEYLSMFPFHLGRTLVHGAVNLLPSSDVYMSNEFKLRKFLEGVDEPDIAKRHMRWVGTFNEEESVKILRPEIRSAVTQDPYGFAKEYFDSSCLPGEYNKLLWTYQRTYMMDQVMVKVDRATMYNALEARAPFLDTNVVEFVNSLPYGIKLHGLTPKYLLKKTMEGKLPRDIIYRTKKGFGVPVGEWLRGPLREWGSELLSSENLSRSSIFDPAHVGRLWNEHQKGVRDHRKRLWNILVFLVWWRNFMK